MTDPHGTSGSAAEGDSAIEWFSIDVFDTVTTRAVAAPADVFLVVGERVRELVEVSPAVFALQRQEAEARLRRRLPAGREVSLVAIHEELLRGLPPTRGGADSRMLADIESEVEVDLARPWQPGLQILEEWRRRARFIGFVSDMYLPPDAVTKILVAAGAWREGDALYVSSEQQATKASGRMFELLSQRHGINPARWMHFGDNPEADVAAPGRMGIRASVVRRPASTRRTREVFGIGGGNADRGLRLQACLQQAAGAAPASCDRHGCEIWSLGAHVLGPTLAWYSHAVLREAEKAGLANLWFLARDGEVVCKAATVMKPLTGFRGGMHYVLASRQALHLAALREFDAEAERWILANPETCTPADVARRLGMQDPVRERFLEQVRTVCEPNEPIARRRADIWDMVRGSAFGGSVLETAEKQRLACKAYLASMSDSAALGIVDIGWHANLQCSLHSLLERDDILGFYLGLRGRNPRVASNRVRPLLFGADADSQRVLGAGVSVLEMLFAGSHPGVVGYACGDDGRATGVLADPASWQRQIRWGVGELQGGALDAVGRLAREGLVPTKEEVAGLLRGLLENPSSAEVAAIKDWPTQDLQGTDAAAPLVEKVGWMSLLHASLTGRVPRIGHWDAGARVVNGVPRHLMFRLLRRAHHGGKR